MNYKTRPSSKKEAEERARELRAYLNVSFQTDKWEYDVWYNLEWCYSVRIGTVSVTPNHHTGHYSTLISSDKEHPGTGDMMWSENNSCLLPEESVRLAIKKCVEVFSKIQSIVEENISLLNLNNDPF